MNPSTTGGRSFDPRALGLLGVVCGCPAPRAPPVASAPGEDRVARVPRLTACTDDLARLCTGRFFTTVEGSPEAAFETLALDFGVATCRVRTAPPELEVTLTTWGPQEPFAWQCAGRTVVYPAAEGAPAMEAAWPADFGKGGLSIHNGTATPLASLMISRAGADAYFLYKPMLGLAPGATHTVAVGAGDDLVLEASAALAEGAACARVEVAVRDGRLSTVEITATDGRFSLADHRCHLP